MYSSVIIITSIVSLIISTMIFRVVSGGDLSLRNLNIISMAYYSLLIFSFIGSVLFGLNIDNHYLSYKILIQDSRFYGWLAVQFVMMFFPLNVSFIFKVFNFKNISCYNKYKNLDIKNDPKTEQNTYIIALISTFFVFIAFIYTFRNIGFSNIPVIKLLLGSSSLDLAQSRISVNKNFTGNIYVKNIIAFSLPIILSFITYVYYRTTKKKKWRNLFFFLLIMSLFVKFYDLQKAPVIVYLFTFFIIEVYLGSKISNKLLINVGIGSSLSMILMYIGITKVPLNKILTFKSGPVNRALLSQVAGLFLHIDIFPTRRDFLNGGSFPTIISEKLLNLNHERSARIVMQIVNPRGVRQGTSGVMNTLFIGEAYANFGIKGIIFSVFYVSLIFALIFMIFLKIDKTPLNIALFSYLTVNLTLTLQGGFVDYIYSAVNIMVVLFIIILKQTSLWMQKRKIL